MGQPQKVAITNQKGGVGKTTTTLNVSGALAARGHDVLVVDADPQGGLTWKLGFLEAYRNADHSLYDVLVDDGDLALGDLLNLRVDHDEVDVIPAHIRNFKLEKQLYAETRTQKRLRLAFDRADLDAYDYVLVDAPPNLGPLAVGAILATENILFPSHANQISRHVLELLFDEIGGLDDVYQEYDLQTIGAVLNQVADQGNVEAEIRDWFLDTFSEEHVFVVPDREAVEHAIEYNHSIHGYDPGAGEYPWDSDAVETLSSHYDRIADRIESHE